MISALQRPSRRPPRTPRPPRGRAGGAGIYQAILHWPRAAARWASWRSSWPRRPRTVIMGGRHRAGHDGW